MSPPKLARMITAVWPVVARGVSSYDASFDFGGEMMNRDYRGVVARLLLGAVIGFGAVARAFLPEGTPFESSEAAIPLRDGKTLAADVYVPDTAKNFPVILIQTPYDKSRMRTWWAKADSSERGPLFTDTHYAFVVTDWRDRFASKAAAAPGKIAGNGEDGYDTIDWVVKQPWCNGKVGTWGPSALGAVQFRTMTTHHPNHVCAVPMVMPLNLRHDIYFHGGVLWDEFVTMLAQLGWPLRDQLIAHPIHDAFWANTIERNFMKPDELRIPMLVIGGWYDIYTTAVIDTFMSIREKGDATAQGQARLIMGPWLHRTGQVKNGALEYPLAENYDIGRAQQFFDKWLRGESNDADSAAPVTYFQLGADEWRTSDAWPPVGVKAKEFVFAAKPTEGDSFSRSHGTGESVATTFSSDPANPVPTFGGHVLTQALNGGPQDQRENEARDDVVVFESEVLQAPLAIAGKPFVRLFVSVDQPDADVSAILTDVYPDGRSMLVSEGIQRLRFREGTDQEVFAKPGEIYEIKVDLMDTAITFLPGHRVRVVIAGSNAPKYAVNLNDGGPMYTEGKGRVATATLHHDAVHPSAIVLPALPE